MGYRARIAALVTAGLWAALLACALGAPAAPAGSSVVQPAAPAALASTPVGATPATAPVQFDVGLQLPDRAGAAAFAQAVSDPASASYGNYLTPSEWEDRFSPSQKALDEVSAWLRSAGITVDGVTPDRLTVQASAPAQTVASAFATTLGEFKERGRTVRLARSALSVPSSLAPLISGINGIDQRLARPQGLTGAEAAPRRVRRTASAIPPAFNVGRPCSSYFGEKHDTSDPPYAPGYPSPLPYAVCGYTPPQIQGAYGLSSQIAQGITGKGARVAIVDALASRSLFSDAHQYSERVQPGQPLERSQFSELLLKPFDVTEVCEEEQEWSDEQHLDVEAVHATAPGAHILYVGARSCDAASLEEAVQRVVDDHSAQIITDSWGNVGGELLEPESARMAFDNVLMMAAGTGIGVLFSSGDEGDEFVTAGSDVPDYPASSPYVTSVGGTSLEVGRHNVREGEFGWSTGKSILCTQLLQSEGFPRCTAARLEKWLPRAPGGFQYGGGGATSMAYPEPAYQDAVVPAALAGRNSFLTGTRNRVIPDISMDGDPSTGFRVGELQEFPNGVRYNEYRLGGTSLSSPLLAGVLADANQAAQRPLGFVNPLLYELAAGPASAAAAFDDILPGGQQALARVDYLNEINSREGILTSARVIEYEGRVEFCDEAGHCSHEKVSLDTGPGFDSMTGIGTPGSELLAELAAG